MEPGGAEPRDTNATRAKRSHATLVAWSPSRELDFPQWAAAGRRLGAMGRCCQWTIGDWIRYGHAKFGERYGSAAQITGYDVQTLMNMVHVASRFTVSRRRENLSWSHHETVASLDLDAQDYWLARAIADKLSVADMRLEIRAVKRRPTRLQARGKVAKQTYAHPSTPVAICPKCGQTFTPPEIRYTDIGNDLVDDRLLAGSPFSG